MRRAVARLLVVALILAVAATGAPPAAAHEDVCTAQGTMHTSVPLVYPPDPRFANFTIGFPIGACALTFVPPAMMGVVAGSCGLASGQGVTSSGHPFSFLWVGTELTMTGGVVGTLHVVVDAFVGDSCLSGADTFIVSGSFALAHNLPDPIAPLPRPYDLLTLVPTLDDILTLVPTPDELLTTIDTLLPPGGGPVASALCNDGTITNNTNPDLTVRVQSVGTETWVCVRALNYGGRLVVDSGGGGGGPGLPTLPSTDSESAACPSPTTGNTGDPGDPTYTEYLVGTMVSTSEVWVCARVNSTGIRVVVPVPNASLPDVPTVDWQPDPGTPG